jgi:hypothetical protein
VVAVHSQAREMVTQFSGSLCPVPPRDPSTKAQAFPPSAVKLKKPNDADVRPVDSGGMPYRLCRREQCLDR